jgi:hypothetical protein
LFSIQSKTNIYIGIFQTFNSQYNINKHQIWLKQETNKFLFSIIVANKNEGKTEKAMGGKLNKFKDELHK